MIGHIPLAGEGKGVICSLPSPPEPNFVRDIDLITMIIFTIGNYVNPKKKKLQPKE